MLRVYQADLMNERDAEEAVHQAANDGPGISTGMLLVGGFAMGTIQRTSLEDVEKMYRLNFVTAYNVSRPLYKLMEKQEKGGQLIFTGARPALDPGAARQMTAYALSKSLIFRLAEIINEEGAGKGITATVLVPGIIDTPQNRESMPESDFTKWVTPEQIAENLLHLLTPAGREGSHHRLGPRTPREVRSATWEAKGPGSGVSCRPGEHDPAGGNPRTSSIGPSRQHHCEES